MFITRKRYEKEIRKKVRAAIRQHDLETACRQQDRQMKVQKDKIKRLENRVSYAFDRIRDLEKKQEPSIQGFYIDKDKNCIPVSLTARRGNEIVNANGCQE